MLETVVVVVHMLGALGVIGLVLLQHGKGADAGASFGAGASGTVFGSQGSATFLSRVTAILAAAFFVTSMALGFFAKEKSLTANDVGLPVAAVVEVKQDNPAADDVPVLEAPSPAANTADVPKAAE
ncbi:MAG: preprotein translocase subunit SecG [Pseudomonas sp.]|jgi:preprotein translocase subunit SecG